MLRRTVCARPFALQQEKDEAQLLSANAEVALLSAEAEVALLSAGPEHRLLSAKAWTSATLCHRVRGFECLFVFGRSCLS